jgi:tetratricopeptide (TPR) repeat protein
LEQSLACYDFERPREYGFIQDPGATGLAQSAHVLHSLGYSQQALQRSLNALAHARQLAHPYTLVWVLNSVAAIHARRGEFDKAEKLWAEQVALSMEQNSPSFLASGIVGHGLALVEQGQKEEAIVRIREGSELFPAAQANPERQNYLIRLAEAYRKLWWPKEGLAAVAKALELLDETGGSAFGTCYRLKGDLLLMTGGGNEAEAQHCFRVAIQMAQAQSARNEELVATTSLARLLASQGRRDEARAMLAEIYS